MSKDIVLHDSMWSEFRCSNTNPVIVLAASTQS